jgi:site-specific recombinase XerD
VVNDLADYYYNERDELTKGRDYKPGENAFMLHSRGGRMRKHTYNKYLKAIIERTGNEAIKEKQITIHSLRHSIATHLLEQGIAVEQVRMFLGHSQLETTQIYTHISKEQLKELIK